MKTMNRIVLASLVALTAAAPLSAMAAPAKAHTPKPAKEQSTTGAIASVSATEVKLSNGETFKLSPGVSASNFKAGDKVQLRWTMKDGSRLADHINAAKN